MLDLITDYEICLAKVAAIYSHNEELGERAFIKMREPVTGSLESPPKTQRSRPAREVAGATPENVLQDRS